MLRLIKNFLQLGDIPEPDADLLSKREAFRKGLIDMDELRDRLILSSIPIKGQNSVE